MHPHSWEGETNFYNSHHRKFTKQVGLGQCQKPVGHSLHQGDFRPKGFSLLFSALKLGWPKEPEPFSGRKTVSNTWEYPFFFIFCRSLSQWRRGIPWSGTDRPPAGGWKEQGGAESSWLGGTSQTQEMASGDVSLQQQPQPCLCLTRISCSGQCSPKQTHCCAQHSPSHCHPRGWPGPGTWWSCSVPLLVGPTSKRTTNTRTVFLIRWGQKKNI